MYHNIEFFKEMNILLLTLGPIGGSMKLSYTREEYMMFYVLCLTMLASCGFAVADVEVSKPETLAPESQALGIKTIKEEISFGDAESPIEVYFFTHWQCLACKRVESVIYENRPLIEKQSKLFFIDFIVNSHSINYTPYNLSFMMNNKSNYIELRKMLDALSEETMEPSESEVAAAASKIGERYYPLTYVKTSEGVKLFKQLARQFSVTRVPTVVIINTNTRKGKTLSGWSEIGRVDFQKAIDSMK